MLIKFNNIFYDALFIFRHFDHFRRLMFTKFLNHETCNFLAAKDLFCFVFFHPVPSFRSYYKAIEIKGTNGRADCIHNSIIVSSTYVVLELISVFREISGTSSFCFRELPSLQAKIYSKILRMERFTKIFCQKIWNTVTILLTCQRIF